MPVSGFASAFLTHAAEIRVIFSEANSRAPSDTGSDGEGGDSSTRDDSVRSVERSRSVFDFDDAVAEGHYDELLQSQAAKTGECVSLCGYAYSYLDTSAAL